MIRLQQRDRNLLSGLANFGLLSTSQIAKWYFAGVARTTVLRRLRILQQNQLILSPGHLSNAMKVWSLSKTGALVLDAPEPFRFSNQNTLWHDVCLSELRKCLEESGVARDWTSDKELVRQSADTYAQALIPDGIFVSDVFGATSVVALELELHAKSHIRYRKLFFDYSFMSAIGCIWYVLKEDSSANPITKQWIAHKKRMLRRYNQRLLISRFDDLISNTTGATVRILGECEKQAQDIFKVPQNCSSQVVDVARPLSS